MSRRCCCEIESEIDNLETELGEAVAAVKAAMEHLRQGRLVDAMHKLSEVCPDHESEMERKKEEELAGLFADWRKQPMPRPDFLTFAHKRRKWSAT